MAAPLLIGLLGRVELRVGDREVRLPSRGPQSLLAVLALKPRVRTREAVASEIWPDGEGSGVSASLRQALWLLRSAFNGTGLDLDEYLDIDAEVVGFRPSVQLDLDVARFERLLEMRPARPEEALAIYRGDLTECLALECFALERERLCDAYEDALALAAEARMIAGDVDGARSAALRLLSRDPLREEAHAVLISAHGQAGSRSQVVRQYRRLAEMLERELGVEPLPETDAAFRMAMVEVVERSRLRAAMLAYADAQPAARPTRRGGLVPAAAQR
jgi:DNA-binding SARP family transcriptional activator